MARESHKETLHCSALVSFRRGRAYLCEAFARAAHLILMQGKLFTRQVVFWGAEEHLRGVSGNCVGYELDKGRNICIM